MPNTPDKAPGILVAVENQSEEFSPATAEPSSTPAAEKIVTTTAALKEAVGEAVQAATTELAGQVQTAGEEIAKVAQRVDELTAAGTPAMVTASAPEQPIVTTPSELKAVVSDAMQAAADAAKVLPVEEPIKATEIAAVVQTVVAEQMAVVREEVQQQATETAAIAKTAMAAEVAAQVATAQAEQSQPAHRRKEDQPLVHTMVKSQSSLNWLLFGLVIALFAYIIYDKTSDKQAPIPMVTEEIQLPSIINLLEAEKQPPQIFQDSYEQIIKKQADALEQKPISDVQVRETVGQIILLNDKISGESGIIQQKIEALKRDGLSDAEAVSKAFLDPAIAPAVLDELPGDIKSLPQTQEFIKSELAKISNYVKREYANRALNR